MGAYSVSFSLTITNSLMSVSSLDCEELDLCELDSNPSLSMSVNSSPKEADSYMPLETLQVVKVQENLTVLESLVPLINDLPGLTLENQVYYANQTLSKNERDTLLSKAFSVVDLTLTEQSDSGKLSAGVFMTLAKAQPYDESLFLSLKHLRLKDAGSYLNYLDLFLGPSLESIEISGVPEAHEESLLSFLKAAAVQLSQLKSLTFNDGHLSLASLQSSLQLRSLRSLALFTCAATFDISLLKAIGSLPHLEEFVFKPAQRYSYNSESLTTRIKELTRLKINRQLSQVDDDISSLQVQVGELRTRNAVLQCKEETFQARFREVEAVLNELELRNCRVSITSSTSDGDDPSELRTTMLRQQKLHGIPLDRFDAVMSLISELGLEPARLTTRKRGSIGSLTSVIWDRLRLYLGAEEHSMGEHDDETTLAELEIKLGVRRRNRDRITAESIGLGMGSVNTTTVDADSLSASATAQDQRQADLQLQGQGMVPLFSRLRILEASASVGLIVDLIGVIEAPAIQRLSLTIDTLLSGRADVREVELEARTSILRTLEKWQRTFKAVSLSVSDGPPISISDTLFSNILLSPEIEQIELSGFEVANIDSSFDSLGTARLPSKLQHLHIPCQPSKPGISLSRLRQIAEACPDLISLRCRFENLAQVKQHTLGEAAADPMSHQLRVLSVGNTEEQLNPGALLHVARYLDILFPNLESINPLDCPSQSDSQWEFIGSMVKAFHSARLDDVARAKMRYADGA